MDQARQGSDTFDEQARQHSDTLEERGGSSEARFRRRNVYR